MASDLEINARDLLEYVQGIRAGLAPRSRGEEVTASKLFDLEEALNQLDTDALEVTIARVRPPADICPTCKRKL